MYGIYGNMDPINIPPMLAYIPYMDPMGDDWISGIIWNNLKINRIKYQRSKSDSNMDLWLTYYQIMMVLQIIKFE